MAYFASCSTTFAWRKELLSIREQLSKRSIGALVFRWRGPVPAFFE